MIHSFTPQIIQSKKTYFVLFESLFCNNADAVVDFMNLFVLIVPSEYIKILI